MGSPQPPEGSGHTHVEMSTSKQSLPKFADFKGPGVCPAHCGQKTADHQDASCGWLACPRHPGWTCVIRAALVLLPGAAFLSRHNSKAAFKLCPTSALVQKLLYHQECPLVLIPPSNPKSHPPHSLPRLHLSPGHTNNVILLRSGSRLGCGLLPSI